MKRSQTMTHGPRGGHRAARALVLVAIAAAASWLAGQTRPAVAQSASPAAPPVVPVAPAASGVAAPVAAPVAAARPKVGLVLSGGGARGGAHIGVLRVLEALKVPVDVIVGTSAGSIVGAAYATGMPLESIEREMKTLNTSMLFHDLVRREVPYVRKSDDAFNYVGPEVGVNSGGVALPKGAVAGVALEAVLRRLTARQNSDDFDDLPIRFRAVATDVADGEMVVLQRGSLAAAIRASMAIPAAVNPVEIDGRLLVDGGVVRNLPVDVARALGAQVIIAVNIGTPPLRREEIGSLLSISEQMTRFLTASNVSRSLLELGPDDVLISPDLGDISTAQFDRLIEAADAGVRAAEAQRGPLAALAVDAQTFAAFSAVRTQHPLGRQRMIARLDVEGARVTREEVIRASMDSQPGSAFDPDVVEADMKRIYGRGDYEHVSYVLTEQAGVGPVLTTKVSEKAWGPHYLRFGLGLSSDFGGNTHFTMRFTHRATWRNRLGGEWRNDLQIGPADLVRTAWHQPLNPEQDVFVSAHAQVSRTPFDLYVKDLRVARFRWDLRSIGTDVGWAIGDVGELRLGLETGRAKILTDTSFIPGAQLSPAVSTGGVSLRLHLDTLDSLRYPRSGFAADLRLYRSSKALGADGPAYTGATGGVKAAFAAGDHAIQVAGLASQPLSGELPNHELNSLGGFLRLSGYHTGQFIGNELRFARAVYTWRIAGPGLLDGAYLGVSTEVGRLSGNSASPSDTLHGNAIYVTADTFLGPVYLAYGRASTRHSAFYFLLGVP